MANNLMNIGKEVEYYASQIDDYNKLLGRGLTVPFNPSNSGSRKLMSAIHHEHKMDPNHAEVPIIQTGYENEFGRNSSSWVTAESNYEVIYKINKFSFNDSHYYLIIRDTDTGIYDVIERVTYNHNTESYGYLFNNSYLDSLKPGSKIKQGTRLKSSIGFDDYGNKMDGVNLTTMYLSCAQNMEDSVIISESAAKKLETSLIKQTDITINDNDILINLYGDENRYKTFPDIGEEIKDGIFCGVRRLENDNMLYTLSQSRLRDIMMSDKCILMDGVVADIDVYCNNPEAIGDSYYNQQLYFYYTERINFCKTVNELVGPLYMNGKLSYNLNKLYSICRDTVAGKQFFKEKQFNNVIMQITIIEKLEMNPGDKLSDRYGGKGVVSEIRPDSMMPRLSNGTVVECIKNQSTVINRENMGQIHEQSLTFIGSKLIDYFKTGVLSYHEMTQMWYDFVSEVDPKQANYMKEVFNLNDDYEAKIFIDGLIDDDAIILSLEPFTTPVDIDLIAKIYKKFPWIKPYRVSVPMEDSNGNIRYIETRRPLVIGKIYTYRLKQYAEEKFSVTSLCATNLKNLNTRSKANKMYESKFKKTPIMFGAMESGNMAHLSMQLVIMNLMLYSSSPQGRRLFEQLLTGNPYNIDIKLDKDSKNRNAEIINAIFKTMGNKLVFKKIPKVKNYAVREIVAKLVPNKDFKYKTHVRDIIGHDDELAMKYSTAIQDKNSPIIARPIVIKKVDKYDKTK